MIERAMPVMDRAESDLADFYRQHVTWSAVEAPMPATVCRGNVTVPVDYTNPGGDTIDLAIVRHAATDPARRLGVLLVAPDDPGSPGIPLLWQLLPTLPPELVERYDIVCFDHRFSGESAPLRLGLSMEEIFWVFHSSPDFDAECRFQEGIAQKAADSALASIPHVTSINIARDMDIIRGALNEEKLSYLGYSYGSYLGAVYTQLFGERAGWIVLDSVLSPDWVWRGLFCAIAASMESGLTEWAGWAAAHHPEMQLGATPARVRRLVDDLLAAASRQPVVIPGLPLPLDGALLRLVIMALLQSDRTHRQLADLVRAAVEQVSPSRAAMELLGAMFGRPRDESTAAAQLIILSGEHPWPRSKDVYRHDAREDGERYPFVGAALAGVKPGAFWPVAPREPVTTIGRGNRAESILLVQSAGDVFAPSHGARRLRELLPHNSRAITVASSVQHRVFPFYGHDEVNERVRAYLVDGALPDTDRVCVNPAPNKPDQGGSVS